MLIGILEPNRGQVFYNGQDIQKDVIAYRKRLGYVPEEANLYLHLTGYEYLEMVGNLRGMTDRLRKIRTDALLQLFSLWPSRHVPLGSYSKECGSAFF